MSIRTKITWISFPIIKTVWNPEIPTMKLEEIDWEVLWDWKCNILDKWFLWAKFEKPINLKCWKKYMASIWNLWIELRWRKLCRKRSDLNKYL